jgi:uncharacterized membrane protein
VKQPQLLTRIAGSPPGALLICAAGAGVLRQWQLGHVSVWVALITAALLWQTLMAVGKVYRYKQWRKQWNSIGQEKPEKKKIERSPAFRLMRTVIVCVALMGAALAANKLGIEDNYSAIVFFGALLWLLGSLVRYVVARVRARGRHSAGAAKDSGAVPAPVSQSLNVPRSAPSRHFAEKNLPQYAAALLTPQVETEHQAETQQAARFYAPPQESYAEQPQRVAPTQRGAFVLASWVWPLAAAVIIAAVLGGLAYFRQGVSANAKQEAPVNWDNYSKVWVDPHTGLTWAKKDNGSAVDWEAAREYCNTLKPARYDWRLPRLEELRGIWTGKQLKGGISISSDDGFPALAIVWTDTPWAPVPSDGHSEYRKTFVANNGSDGTLPITESKDANRARVLCVSGTP